ncbi:MAG: class I SAM-dependent methyltransferase [Lentisphaerota bacterium]
MIAAIKPGFTDVVPEEIWTHELFVSSAIFRPPSSPLLIERYDAQLRRINNMPSTADQSAANILQNAGGLLQQASSWIKNLPKADGQLLSRIDRIQQLAVSGVTNEMVERGIRSLRLLIPKDLQSWLPAEGSTRGEAVERLHLLSILVLERCVMDNRDMARRYLKHLYKLLDRGLAYNATTDLRRLIPVLDWMRQILRQQRRSGSAYVDVGCAAAAGAPGVIAAADLLRRDGLCSTVHGVDIAAPARSLAQDLALHHQILVYQSHLLHHPLPRKYDVILLANVHRHLTRDLQARLLRHLCGSLHEYGLVFINWRFSDRSSPCIYLQKRRGILLMGEEKNCITPGLPLR